MLRRKKSNCNTPKLSTHRLKVKTDQLTGDFSFMKTVRRRRCLAVQIIGLDLDTGAFCDIEQMFAPARRER